MHEMSWRAGVVAFAAYSLAAIALTFPLVLHLSSLVPHDPGDPMLSAAILWWNAHVLPFTDRWWNGFAFYPAPGMMAFSDARLGESVIATPLQWMGLGPVAAYNVTLLATYPLCGVAAYWLAFVLTRRHDAAWIAGAAYAFCPFRAAHIQHLELLGGFALPAALASLHRYVQTARARWLVAFAIAIVWQALCASYYALFSGALFALWLVWFVAPDWRKLAAIGAATAAAAVALSPLAVGYERVHAHFGFERPLPVIVELSGDVASFVLASPMLALWGWTTRRFGEWPERELFPGLLITTLAIVGGFAAWWRTPSQRDRLDRTARWLMPLAAILAAVAAFGWWLAPWRMALPGLLITSDAPFKPFSIAIAIAVIAFALSSRMRAAFASRSALAFYLIAAGAMFACSLGPKPAFRGHQFFYQPPYAWLMALPGFAAVRVPARFAMLGMLPLSIAGALAFAKLPAVAWRRVAAVATVCIVLAEGWVMHMPLAAVPEGWSPQHAQGFAAVLELPIDSSFHDLSAMYRAIAHGRPVVNGNSGFEPNYYMTLRAALEEHDPAVFDEFELPGRLLIVVDEEAPGGWTSFVLANPRATLLGHEARWTFVSLAPRAATATCSGASTPLASARDTHGATNLRAITDDDPLTFWANGRPQQPGDALTLELAAPAQPCAVQLSNGPFIKGYPRALTIQTSIDGTAWQTVSTLRTAGLAIRAGLDHPVAMTMTIPIRAPLSRFIRLQLADRAPDSHWVVTKAGVLVTP
jgi:hypothetical protein